MQILDLFEDNRLYLFVSCAFMEKEEFFRLIEARLRKYPELLAMKNDWQTTNAFAQAAHCVVMEIKNHFLRFKVEQGEFWGYGINSVSDGKEKNTNLDVDRIRYAEPLNRHHNPQCCILALILFKIQDYQFVYKVFSINVPRAKINNDQRKNPLKEIENKRIKTRQIPDLPTVPEVFVELFFSNKELPVSFQIDTMLNAQSIGNQYIEKIEKLSKEAKKMEELKQLQNDKPKKLLIYGGFWLALFLIIFGAYLSLVVMGHPWWVILLIAFVVATSYSLIAITVLRNLGDLSEKSFVSLLGLVLRLNLKALISQKEKN